MRVFIGLLLILSVLRASAFSMEYDSNVPDFLKKQVEEDIRFVDSIRKSRDSGLHSRMFANSGQGGYRKWFDARVSFFGYGDCGGSNRAVACVLGRNDRKIWVTKNYVEIEHPQVARVMTLFHEARHTEGDRRNWPHSRCSILYKQDSIWTGNPLRWRFACDRTEYGSYGLASVLLNNVARFCMNCSEKVRLDADIYSNDQILRITRRSAFLRIRRDFME
ncbi:MAG: hypothetical protein KGP28_11410 [Bdellovibrionales bacterium]|nr:hypothetical protein [Bdellovibrionales bacterium]